jgi:hypothetical protein
MGAEMAASPRAYDSEAIAKPCLPAWRTAFITAAIEVGALGPKRSGLPMPCLDTSAIASSSSSVDSHAKPVAVHDSCASMPMSGS